MGPGKVIVIAWLFFWDTTFRSSDHSEDHEKWKLYQACGFPDNILVIIEQTIHTS